jgi:hypothetical protein
MDGPVMTSTPLLIALAFFFTALLLWLTRDEDTMAEDEAPTDALVETGFPDGKPRAEIVFRVFSAEDQKFIYHLQSPRLRRMYQQERRKVALHWVVRTARDVKKIMQAHRLASRESQNLDVRTETKLLLQYLRLRLTCALLILLIKSFGPHFLIDLAAHASELYRGIGRALVAEGSLRTRIATAEETTTH